MVRRTDPSLESWVNLGKLFSISLALLLYELRGDGGVGLAHVSRDIVVGSNC